MSPSAAQGPPHSDMQLRPSPREHGHIRAASAASAASALDEMLGRSRQPSVGQQDQVQFARAPPAPLVVKPQISPGPSVASSSRSLGLGGATMSSKYTPILLPPLEDPSYAESIASFASSRKKSSNWPFRRAKTAPIVISEPVPRQQLPELDPLQRMSASSLMARVEGNSGQTGRGQTVHHNMMFPVADDEQERLESPLELKSFEQLRRARPSAPPQASPSPSRKPSKKRGFFRLFTSRSSPDLLNLAASTPDPELLAYQARPRNKASKRGPDVPNIVVVPFDLPTPKKSPPSQQADGKRDGKEVKIDTPRKPGASRRAPSPAVRAGPPSQPPAAPLPAPPREGRPSEDSLDWLARSSMLFPTAPPATTAPTNAPMAQPIPPTAEITPTFVSQPVKPKPLPVRPGVVPGSPTRKQAKREAGSKERSGSVSTSASSALGSSTSSTASKSSATSSRSFFGWFKSPSLSNSGESSASRTSKRGVTAEKPLPEPKERLSESSYASSTSNALPPEPHSFVRGPPIPPRHASDRHSKVSVADWLEEVGSEEQPGAGRTLSRTNSDASIMDPHMAMMSNSPEPLPLSGMGDRALVARAGRRPPGTANSDTSVLDPHIRRLPPLQPTKPPLHSLPPSPQDEELLRSPSPAAPESVLSLTPRAAAALLPSVGIARERHLSAAESFPSSISSGEEDRSLTPLPSHSPANTFGRKSPHPRDEDKTPRQATFPELPAKTSTTRDERPPTGSTMASLSHSVSTRRTASWTS